jgi:hypothetical protein
MLANAEKGDSIYVRASPARGKHQPTDDVQFPKNGTLGGYQDNVGKGRAGVGNAV